MSKEFTCLMQVQHDGKAYAIGEPIDPGKAAARLLEVGAIAEKKAKAVTNEAKAPIATGGKSKAAKKR